MEAQTSARPDYLWEALETRLLSEDVEQEVNRLLEKVRVVGNEIEEKVRQVIEA
jgi:hypothetical protein